MCHNSCSYSNFNKKQCVEPVEPINASSLRCYMFSVVKRNFHLDLRVFTENIPEKPSSAKYKSTNPWKYPSSARGGSLKILTAYRCTVLSRRLDRGIS